MGLHLHHPIHTNLPINNLYLDKEPIYTVPASKRAINHPDFSISQFLGIFNKPTRAGKSHHFCWWFSYVFFTCRVPAKKIYRQVIYYYFSTNLLCYLIRADYVVCIYIHIYMIYMYIDVYSPLWNWHELDFSSYIAWWSKTMCSTSTRLTTAVRNQDFPICLLLKIYSTSSISKITSGWWYTYPSKKYEFVSWDDEIPNIWKNKIHVPNHQPGLIKSPN